MFTCCSALPIWVPRSVCVQCTQHGNRTGSSCPVKVKTIQIWRQMCARPFLAMTGHINGWDVEPVFTTPTTSMSASPFPFKTQLFAVLFCGLLWLCGWSGGHADGVFSLLVEGCGRNACRCMSFAVKAEGNWKVGFYSWRTLGYSFKQNEPHAAEPELHQ